MRSSRKDPRPASDRLDRRSRRSLGGSWEEPFGAARIVTDWQCVRVQVLRALIDSIRHAAVPLVDRTGLSTVLRDPLVTEWHLYASHLRVPQSRSALRESHIPDRAARNASEMDWDKRHSRKVAHFPQSCQDGAVPDCHLRHLKFHLRYLDMLTMGLAYAVDVVRQRAAAGLDRMHD